MHQREPTAAERTFFEELSTRVPGLHDWYHEDPDGRPWMIASHDFVVGNGIHDTLRIDTTARIFAAAGVLPASTGTAAYLRTMHRSTRPRRMVSAPMTYPQQPQRRSPGSGSPITALAGASPS